MDYLNIEENFSEFLHSIFRNISVNNSLLDVSNQMEHHHAMIDDNDEDLYVDYLVDDYNIGENDMDAIDEYQNQDTSEDEFIQFLKDHIDYLNIEENFSEFLHSIFRNISVNNSLFDVSKQMEHHQTMMDDNDEDLYVDYLVDDYNIGENDMDANDEYQV
ncbi:unnamed protein product [Rotaria sp. Silwood1]|nr:unnamed protein product [Rotaria sp. Silwood1]